MPMRDAPSSRPRALCTELWNWVGETRALPAGGERRPGSRRITGAVAVGAGEHAREAGRRQAGGARRWPRADGQREPHAGPVRRRSVGGQRARAAARRSAPRPQGAAPASTGAARRPSRPGPGPSSADARDRQAQPHGGRPEHQAAIAAAEAEGVARARAAPAGRGSRSATSRAERRIEPCRRSRQPGTSPCSMAERGDHRLERRRRRPACGRSSPWWSCTARRRRTRASTARSSVGVVGPGAGAVQVDVVDVGRRQPRRRQRRAHGERRRPAPSGCGDDMWWPSLLAPTPSSSARRAPAPRRPLQQREAGGLADGDAVAVGVAGPAGRRRSQLQRGEAMQRHAAERVHAADHGGVADAGGDQLAPRRRRPWRRRSRRWRPTSAGPRRPSARAHEARPARTGRACARSRNRPAARRCAGSRGDRRARLPAMPDGAGAQHHARCAPAP